MANLQSTIYKRSDQEILSIALEFAKEINYPIIGINIVYFYGQGDNFKDISELIKNDEFKQIQENQNLKLIKEIIFSFSSSEYQNFNITINNSSELKTQITMNIGNTNHLKGSDRIKFYSNIHGRFEKYFPNISNIDEKLIDRKLKENLEIRELELSKLQDSVLKIQNTLADTIKSSDEKYSAQYKRMADFFETQYQNRLNELEDLYKDKQKKLNDENELKLKEIYKMDQIVQEKIKALDEREKNLDTKNSKFARRDIRKQIKEIIEARNKNFQLTQNTQKLNTPIQALGLIFIIILLGGFGVVSYLNMIYIYENQALDITKIIVLSIKQFSLGIPLIFTVIFMIKWYNARFQKHAAEEFYLKRIDLDIDRASWLVELALEWHTETNKEIPKELIERISYNLFAYEENRNQEKNTSLDSLLGLSSELTLGPNGATIKYDKKGIQGLSQAAKEDPAPGS